MGETSQEWNDLRIIIKERLNDSIWSLMNWEAMWKESKKKRGRNCMTFYYYQEWEGRTQAEDKKRDVEKKRKWMLMKERFKDTNRKRVKQQK